MHILIIPSEEYIPKNHPLAGIFQHDQAKIIQQKGNKVGVISFTFSHSFFSLIKAVFGQKTQATQKLNFYRLIYLIFQKTICPFKSALSYESIDFVNVIRCDGYWGVKSSPSDLVKLDLWNKFGMFAIKQYITQHGEPDVIHAHNMLYAGLLAYQTQQYLKIPVVITEHSSQYAMGTISNNLNDKLKEVFNTQPSIFAVSPKLIDLLSHKFINNSNKIKWLPNVLDPVIEETPFSPKERDNKIIRFLNIANLIELKGQKELIESFAKAFQNNENVELIIAGEGELVQVLNQLILKLQVQQKVKLIGLINREEVVRQIDNCNVFVLPSHYETFGVVLIEALSRGIPVISTYCGGPECIVNKNNGILVEPNNINELAEAMLKMYNQHNNYDKLDLRNNCLSLYGKAAFYEKIMPIYQSVINAQS